LEVLKTKDGALHCRTFFDLLESLELLTAATDNFARRCVANLQPNRERTGAFVEQYLAMGTGLAAEIGYERTAALVKEAYQTGRTVRDVAVEKSGIPPPRLVQLLDAMTQTGK